jgi:hypothetical protein
MNLKEALKEKCLELYAQLDRSELSAEFISASESSIYCGNQLTEEVIIYYYRTCNEHNLCFHSKTILCAFPSEVNRILNHASNTKIHQHYYTLRKRHEETEGRKCLIARLAAPIRKRCMLVLYQSYYLIR